MFGGTFGEVLSLLKNGGKCFRKGWHLQGMYIALQTPDENSANNLPYIYICIPTGAEGSPEGTVTHYDRVPWLASQTDMLAEDWDFIS